MSVFGVHQHRLRLLRLTSEQTPQPAQAQESALPQHAVIWTVSSVPEKTDLRAACAVPHKEPVPPPKSDGSPLRTSLRPVPGPWWGQTTQP